MAGHVTVGDNVVFGGFALVYQFVNIGKYSICGFSSGVKSDVPPYSMIAGNPAKAISINLEGLRRNDFSKDEIKVIREAFKVLYKKGLTLEESKKELNEMAKKHPVINEINDFLPTMKRGLIR